MIYVTNQEPKDSFMSNQPGFFVYKITDPCGYCNNRFGYKDGGHGGYCPVCEKNYFKEAQVKDGKE